MKIYSSKWDESTGVCNKHSIAVLPCPCCLNEQDDDVYVELSATDRDVIAFEGVSLVDLMPVDHPWLAQRLG